MRSGAVRNAYRSRATIPGRGQATRAPDSALRMRRRCASQSMRVAPSALPAPRRSAQALASPCRASESRSTRRNLSPRPGGAMRASGTSDAKPPAAKAARSARRAQGGRAANTPIHEAATKTAATLRGGTRAGQSCSHHSAKPARAERRDRPRSRATSVGAGVTEVDLLIGSCKGSLRSPMPKVAHIAPLARHARGTLASGTHASGTLGRARPQRAPSEKEARKMPSLREKEHISRIGRASR